MSNIVITVYNGTKKTSDEIITESIRMFAADRAISLPDNIKIVRQEFKKPYTENVPLFFSLSHSGDYTVCAVSSCCIGIDLQKVKNNNRDRSEYIASNYFSLDEYLHLKENDFEDFFDIWTAKESVVKYTGEGITEEFNGFSVLNNTDFVIKEIPFIDGYKFVICTDEEFEAEIVYK